MPGKRPLYADFFYPPLTEDVEELLSRFQQTDSVRFEQFSAIWREMAFPDVFLGIPNVAEVKRFCRVALATAVKYFLPPYSYQIRVGGLYLLYGFYHVQLSVPPLKIRLALKDWDPVQRFLGDAVDARHYDVVYVFRRLAATKAVHYAAMPHFLTFQKQRRPKREPVCAEFLGRTAAVQELVPLEKLEEIANIQTHYEEMKGGTADVQSNVAVIHRDFAARLKDSVSDFVSWQEKTFSNPKADNPGTPTCRTTVISSVKRKSYSTFQPASKARRHRQAAPAAPDSSGSEEEPPEGTVPQRCRRPQSLRARTWKNLGVTQRGKKDQSWLLTTLEQDAVPAKTSNQVAPA